MKPVILNITVCIIIFSVLAGWADSRLPLLDRAERETDPQKVKNIYTSLIEQYPENPGIPEVIFKLGKLYFFQEEYTAALKYFELLRTQYPGSRFIPDTMYWRALVYYMQGEFDRSLEVLQLFVIRYAGHPLARAAHINRADILYHKGDVAKALRAYWQVLMVYVDIEKKGWIYFQMGNCFFFAHQWEEAYNAYNTVKTFFPGTLEAGKAGEKMQLILKREGE